MRFTIGWFQKPGKHQRYKLLKWRCLMKQNPKKLKLTKLTVANLQRVKGGKPPCDCDPYLTNGAWNRDRITSWDFTYCC